MAVKKTSLKAVKAKEEGRNLFRCSCCGKEYIRQKGNFPKNQSPLYKGNDYYLNWCKTCVDSMYEQYIESIGDEDLALKRVCMKTDTYFNETLAGASRKISADRSRISAYLSKSHMIQYKDKTYDTTIDEEGGTIENMQDLHINNKKIADTDAYEPVSLAVSTEDIAKWNYGFKPEEYLWLNNKYDEIRSTNVIDTTTREELVRDYCVQKLLQSNALRDDKMDLYDKFADRAQKTLDRANLTPKIADAADKAGEKPIGVMIQMFEKEEPIPKPRPEWRDVDGIVKLITVYFLGHLMKMFGIKHRYAKMYEDEMNKYRADDPSISEMDDEEIFSNLVEGNIKFHENTSGDGGDSYGI